MLGQQIRAWEVLDARVLSVLERTPREQFMPAGVPRSGLRRHRDTDRSRPVPRWRRSSRDACSRRCGSSPSTASSRSVCGSGYPDGLFGAARDSECTSIDVFPDFVDAARVKMADHGIYNVELGVADALKMSGAEQFDAIAITASMPELDGRFIRATAAGRQAVRHRRSRTGDGGSADHDACQRPLEPGKSVRDRDRPADQRGQTGTLRPLAGDPEPDDAGNSGD